ncbi:MAG: hypothetical protein JW841_17100 [Deltaproteobacteria bacterium]|nr:hypothetical protein [Deltaproteobacteria bacterium]
MIRKLLGLLFVVSAYGCIEIVLVTETSFNSQVQVGFGGLAGECSGTAVVNTNSGQTSVTRRLNDNGSCAIEITFTTTLIKMADLRKQIEDKIKEQGRNPNDVDLKITSPSAININNMIIDGVDLPGTSWRVDLSMLGSELAAISGDDVSKISQETINIPLSNDNITTLNVAYKEGSDVAVNGTFTFENISASALQELPQNIPVFLSLDVLAQVHAEATFELF